MNYRHINSTPDTTNNAQLPFPGFATTGSQQSTRWTTSESLRSTFGAEPRERIPRRRVRRLDAVFAGARARRCGSGATVGNQGGYRLNINTACCGTGFQLTNPGLNSDAAVARSVDQGDREHGDVAEGQAQRHVRRVVRRGQRVAAEPDAGADGELRPAGVRSGRRHLQRRRRCPGASANDITQAKSLYAMLTGRVTSLAGDARITPAGDSYVPLGLSRAQGRMREFDFFAADSWRARPSLTISAGLRYVLALPFYPTNNSYTTVTEAEPVRRFRRRQPVQAGDDDRDETELRAVSRGHLRLQHRPEQPRAERAASPGRSRRRAARSDG